METILGLPTLYIDPAATSALFSLVTVVLAGLGASIVIFWRKLKKKVNKTFKIDPNKNKEVEDDLIVKDEETILKTENKLDSKTVKNENEYSLK